MAKKDYSMVKDKASSYFAEFNDAEADGFRICREIKKIKIGLIFLL